VLDIGRTKAAIEGILVGKYEDSPKDTKALWCYFHQHLYAAACPDGTYKTLHKGVLKEGHTPTMTGLMNVLTRSDEAMLLTILEVKHERIVEEYNVAAKEQDSRFYKEKRNRLEAADSDTSTGEGSANTPEDSTEDSADSEGGEHGRSPSGEIGEIVGGNDGCDQSVSDMSEGGAARKRNAEGGNEGKDKPEKKVRKSGRQPRKYKKSGEAIDKKELKDKYNEYEKYFNRIVAARDGKNDTHGWYAAAVAFLKARKRV
jgi:hypothetical protein